MRSVKRRNTSLAAPSVIRQLSGYGFAKIAPGIIGLVMIPLWVRVFGEAAYALYSVLWVVGNFGAAIAVGWIRQAILRFSGDQGGSERVVSKVICLIAVVVGAIPLVVTSFFVAAGSEDLFWILLSGTIFALLNGVYLIDQARAQSASRVGVYAAAELTRAGVALGLSMLLGGALGFGSVPSMIGGYGIATAGAILILRRRAPRAIAISATTEYWRYGWPMSVWLALSQVLVYFDRLFLAPHISASQLGSYAATSDLIIRGMGMVAFPITMFAHPLIMRRWNANARRDALKLNRNSMIAILILGLVVVVLLAICGRVVLSWLLDAAVPDMPVILCLGIGAALWQVALQSHKPLEMMNLTGLMVVLLLGTCALTIGALLWLTPAYGELAAAATFAGGAGFYVLVTYFIGVSVMRGSRRIGQHD